MVNPIQAQKFLGGMDYPASKNEIVKRAEQQGADENVLDIVALFEAWCISC